MGVNPESNSSGKKNFACDAMLGRLARWLRLLGYDTFYSSKVKDDELLDICLRKNFILLTRDLEVFKRAVSYSLNVKLLRENSFTEQFAEIVGDFGLDLKITPDGSRCPACNGLIRGVKKEEIRNKVPVNTLNSYDSFWICSNCNQVYWMGRMWRSMIQIVEKIKNRR
ncbi:MAG: Mut7-C RNAse domain-containing protein [Candidatus Jordarchaeum sp.]|uniref:Mut7-C RNAse domain-containing protein n=1 Tax=Candidatus Jordarchaeum sp. TaxID=2823881 RepID=UPI0040492B90